MLLSYGVLTVSNGGSVRNADRVPAHMRSLEFVMLASVVELESHKPTIWRSHRGLREGTDLMIMFSQTTRPHILPQMMSFSPLKPRQMMNN